MRPEQSAQLQKFAKAVAALIHEHGLDGKVTVAMGFRDEEGDAYCKQVGDGGVDFATLHVSVWEPTE